MLVTKMIFQLLAKYGVPENVVALIRDFHKGFGAKLSYKRKLGERFSMSTRVRQVWTNPMLLVWTNPMELLFLLRAANLERRKRSKHREWSHRRI